MSFREENSSALLRRTSINVPLLVINEVLHVLQDAVRRVALENDRLQRPPPARIAKWPPLYSPCCVDHRLAFLALHRQLSRLHPSHPSISNSAEDLVAPLIDVCQGNPTSLRMSKKISLVCPIVVNVTVSQGDPLLRSTMFFSRCLSICNQRPL